MGLWEVFWGRREVFMTFSQQDYFRVKAFLTDHGVKHWTRFTNLYPQSRDGLSFARPKNGIQYQIFVKKADEELASVWVHRALSGR